MPALDRVYQEGEQVGVMSDYRHVHWEVLVDKLTVDPLKWVTGELGPAGASAGGGMGGLLIVGLLLYAASDGRR